MINKKTALIAGIFFTIFVFAACGGNNSMTNETFTKKPVSQSSTYNYNFRSFELDIDTVDQHDAIEASYEKEKIGYEAVYVNKLADINVRNAEALNYLEPIFSSLNIDPTTPDTEVIQRVSEAFGGVDYTDFELEIEFKDGSEREYRSTK